MWLAIDEHTLKCSIYSSEQHIVKHENNRTGTRLKFLHKSKIILGICVLRFMFQVFKNII